MVSLLKIMDIFKYKFKPLSVYSQNINFIQCVFTHLYHVSTKYNMSKQYRAGKNPLDRDLLFV